jgi:predicted flap endonuclease-1-like 5' DNA nuclease
MSTIVIALICFAVAFVSGGLLSKAYFVTRNAPESIGRNKLHTLLQAQRARYRKRMIALNNVIRRHEETRVQIHDKLAKINLTHTERGELLQEMNTKLEQEQKQNQGLEQKLADCNQRINTFDTDKSTSAAMEKEFGVLRIERDELVAQLKRIESGQAQNSVTNSTNEDPDKIACMRADMGEMRETLATRDRRIHDLELQLQDSTDQARQLQTKLDSWKQRIMPLTRKIKQQKELLQRLCRNKVAEQQIETPGDDLKVIHGIGPALERRLQQHGIRHYRQLADMNKEELASIAQKLAIAPNRAERDDWIQQARNLLQQSELHQTA